MSILSARSAIALAATLAAVQLFSCAHADPRREATAEDASAYAILRITGLT